MEETNERIGNSDNRRSAKIEVIGGGGGGGLGGILMVGGTLAALALIGVFTDMAKKKRREPFEGEGKKKQDSTEKFEQRSNNGLLVAGEIEEEGLGSVVQISSSSLEGSLCGRSGSGLGTQIESSISKAVKVGDQFDDQECNNEDDVVEKAIEQIEGAVELSRTDYVDDQIVFEENLADQLQEQDSNSFDDDDDNDEDVNGREEGSEDTVDSSMESNAEPIWPVESIEEESMKLEAMKDRTRIFAGINGNADEAVESQEVHLGNLKIETLKKIPVKSKMRHKILLWSLLAILLLLPLLFHHHVAKPSQSIEASKISS